MSGLSNFYRSAVGKKALMAASGIMLFGFVLVHMLGNLKLYQGPEKLNAYAEWLRDVGSPALPHSGVLWIARLVLLAAVGIHVVTALATDAEKLAGSTAEVSAKRGPRSHLCLANSALGWGHRRPLRGVSPRSPDLWLVTPRFHPGRRLSQRRFRLSGLVGQRDLHRGSDSTGLSPLPRPVEHVSVSRLVEHFAASGLAASIRPGFRLGHHAR